MKTKFKIIIGTAAVVILAEIIFLIWHHANLPRAHPAGTFISKKEFKFAGYDTPEAALETVRWAIIAGDFDAFLKSISPENQIEEKKMWGNAAHYKSEMQKQMTVFKGVQIVAKKILNSDKVELKFLMVDSSDGETVTNYWIQPAARINGKWITLKGFDPGGNSPTNWDESGNIVYFPAK
jgi:hypothetical protein